VVRRRCRRRRFSRSADRDAEIRDASRRRDGRLHQRHRFNPTLGVGAVVLNDQQTVRPGNDIALHLVSGRPVQPPPVKREAIVLGAEALKPFVGRYAFDRPPGRC